MELKILSEEENKLFNRTEIRFEVIHEGEPTPSLNDVRRKLALTTGGMSSHIVIDKFKTLFGIGRSIGFARIYKNKDDMLEYEPEYLLKRNGLLEEKKEEKEGEVSGEEKEGSKEEGEEAKKEQASE